MNKIYNIIGAAFASLALLASCDEWEPVFTGNYGEADIYEPVTMTPNTTILELKKMYTEGTPLTIEKDIIIGGQVISEDKSGNIYKSLYGAYNGMIQLGCEDPTKAYETSYLEAQYLIDTHVFRGEIGTPLTAKKVTEADLKKEENLGCYVELDGLTYGNEIFLLVYIDPNKDTKDNDNRIFFSDKTWGVTTWAMSKQGFINYLNSGVLDSGATNTGRKVTDVKPTLIKNASAYSVSQYFKMGSSDVQVRTSGYARFADTQIDPAILSGSAKVNMKGILSIYKGQAQFTLIDLNDGVEIVK